MRYFLLIFEKGVYVMMSHDFIKGTIKACNNVCESVFPALQ